MNDGEQGIMHKNFNTPVAHLGDSLFRLHFAAHAKCPGLCVGLLNPDDIAAVSALGSFHHDFWVNRGGFQLTESIFEHGLMSTNRTYCFGLVTYRPKSGASQVSRRDFAAAWDEVFQNRNVLLVHPEKGFFDDCPDCVAISDTLYQGGRSLPPFRQVRKLLALNPKLLKYDRIAGYEWPSYIDMVQEAAHMAGADTVAVVWGPSADILVSEMACRGLRALDIGSLISILQGGTDPDETVRSRRVLRACRSRLPPMHALCSPCTGCSQLHTSSTELWR
eukprot:TRINITY_DN24253_c0_g1_i1.p1 TRINITY_DN24253_c0_g1~~TRINITY_DN24253_c0_g1_i1.p1  ORF type:complete len:277 (-),score=30.58 TRINITY_DN24253_c0_g1_i1:172-1002(-)